MALTASNAHSAKANSVIQQLANDAGLGLRQDFIQKVVVPAMQRTPS